MKKRIIWIYKLLLPLVAVFVRLRIGYTYEKVKDLPEGPYIVLSNHTTDYDPLLVGVSFKQQMYFVASEHIMRWGFLSRLLQYAFDPIVRYKGTVAASTVMTILRRIRKGANVCIFAEGARSWDGCTGPILPSTGSLVKSARCSLITYRLEGGYFVSPRWSGASIRRGYLHGAPVHIYTREQLEAMSVEEINEVICRDLQEDAYARQIENPKKYRSKNPADRLDNLLFICPFCGAEETLSTAGDTVQCTACSNSFRYDEFGMLHGLPVKTVRELYAWQVEKVREAAEKDVVYTTEHAVLTAIENHLPIPVAEGALSISREGIRCGEKLIRTEDITDLTMHGQHGIVFSAEKAYYELRPDKTSNALKYQLMYDAVKDSVRAEKVQG